jgi:hypothetical protein
MKLEFSQQIFGKYSDLTKIQPVRSELFHADGRPDRHDEANCRFWQFCESASQPIS